MSDDSARRPQAASILYGETGERGTVPDAGPVGIKHYMIRVISADPLKLESLLYADPTLGHLLTKTEVEAVVEEPSGAETAEYITQVHIKGDSLFDVREQFLAACERADLTPTIDEIFEVKSATWRKRSR